MIIFDNIIFSLQRAGGISVVWSNLLKNIISEETDYKVLEYYNAESNIFRKQIEIPPQNIIRLKGLNKFFSQFKSPKINIKDKFIFHSSYFRTCNNPNAINVTTVHDFIYEQGNPTLKQKLRIWMDYEAICKSDAIVCISNNTKQDLFKYLPYVDRNKVHVIYNGVSEDYFQIQECPYPIYNNSILFVGGRQFYKNFDFAVKAVANTEYRLLICGSPLLDNEISLLEKYLHNRYDVVIYPSSEKLNKIYNSVFALIYPSSYEGFGLPILEAQRAACPVIALRSSSIPEVIGDNTLLMSDLTFQNFLSSVEIIRNDEIRSHIIQRGLINSNKFSWSKMASDYFKLYCQLLQN